MDFDSILLLAHAHHSHEGTGVFQEAWHLIVDPAHAITEIFYNLLFDALLIPIVIIGYKKLIKPRLKQDIHAHIDKEHGIEHSKDTAENIHHCHCCSHNENIK